MVKLDQLIMTPVNGRTVKLSGNVSQLHQDLEDAEIVKIYDEEGYEIKCGDTIYPRAKSPFKVNKIYQGKVNGRLSHYSLMNSKLNNSSIFMLPFLGGNRKLYLWDSLFINAFIGTSPEDTGNVLVLLYRFSGDQLFLKFENALCAFRNFIKRVDIDPYHVLFIFDVPKSATKSYESFVNSRYSEIDDIWKLKILEFHDFEIDGMTGRILFQSESLRKELEERLDVELPKEAELHSALDLDVEVFNPEYYLPKPHNLKS